LEHTGDVTATLAHIEEGNENGSDTNEIGDNVGDEDENNDDEEEMPPLEPIDPPTTNHSAVTPLHDDDDDCPDLVPQGNNDDDDSVSEGSEGSCDSDSDFDDDEIDDDLNDAVFDLERPASTPTVVISPQPTNVSRYGHTRKPNPRYANQARSYEWEVHAGAGNQDLARACAVKSTPSLPNSNDALS